MANQIPPTAPVVISPNGGELWDSAHTISWVAAKDVFQEIVNESHEGQSTLNVGTPKLGQSFTVTEADFELTSVEFRVDEVITVNVEVWNVNDVTGLPSTMIKSQPVVTVANDWTHALINVEGLLKNKKYAISISRVSSNGNFSINAMTPYNKGSYLSFNGSTWSTISGRSLVMRINTLVSATLEYQIQLSPNNGINWSNLISSTSAGATSSIYNFLNTAETSMAKIRVRAYNGTSYGPWDESDGVFTIQHNVAPSIPTNLSPKGLPADKLRTIRFTWKHNDSPNDIQSKADIQWRPQGETLWRAITSDGPEQEYFMPPNTLPYGQIEWQVKTYDSIGVASPWSNIAVFTVGDAADVPTIMQPTGSVNVARPVVEWSSVSQSSYQLVVEDSLGLPVWDTGEITSQVRARTVGVDLLNGGTYTVKVRVKDGRGLFSSFAERTFVVSYTPPAKPIVTTFAADGFIAFNIGTPTPTGTQPTVRSHEIYKRINDEWIRVAYDVGSSYNDYHVRSGETYEYYVKAIALNGTTSNSDIVSHSTVFRGSWIHTLQDPEASLQYFRYNGTGYETTYEPESAVMKFAGRTRPVVHFGAYEDYSLTVRIQAVEGMSDMDVLRQFVRDRETVCYRDADGNLIVGHILTLNIEKEYRVSTAVITIIEADFNEGV